MHTLTPAALNISNPKPGVSDNYEFIPTVSIINLMETQGFHVTKCQQGRSRHADNTHYAIHKVHFQKEIQGYHQELAPEIILINSHNRGAALRFCSGFIRFICENGLIAGDIISDTNKIYHSRSRNTCDSVLERIQTASEHLDSKLEVIERMRNTFITSEEQFEMAYKASFIPCLVNRNICDIRDLIQCKRQEDHSPTVWNVFNRIQENIKKGNMIIKSITNGKVRKARSISGIDTDLKYNQALWNIAETYAE